SLIVASRNVIANSRVEQGQSRRIALSKDQVSEAGSHHFSVLQFRQLARAVFHRLASIQKHMRYVICLLLVLLDIMAIGPRQDLPVQMSNIVPGCVFAVLRELNGEAAIWRLMLARHIAF